MAASSARAGQAFFIATNGPNDEIRGGALGVKWLIEQYEAQRPGEPMMVAETEAIFDSDDALRAGAILFRHESAASWQVKGWSGGAVLLLYPTAATLAAFDALDPIAICVVQGAGTDVAGWVAARQPTVISLAMPAA